ncbi:hypothetical protein GX408_05760 [bacterium]|nr:hypothetical protein [bacterium]
MVFITAVVLSGLAVAYVAWPLFRSGTFRTNIHLTADQTDELLFQKEMAIEMIRDLDFDLHTGKFSAEEHAGLVAAQQRRISHIDARLGGQAGKSAKGKSKNGSELKKLCSRCGHSTEGNARYCPQCGQALTKTQ